MFYLQSRAKQLYANGFKTLEDVAKSSVAELVDKIEYLNYRVAKQLISAAKVSFAFHDSKQLFRNFLDNFYFQVLLLERVETLRSEVQDCLDVLSAPK